MPGIAGFITIDPDQRAAGQRLSKMLRYMRHYPFYVQGTLSLPEHGAFIGWSVLPDSNGSTGPLHSAEGDVTLVFCGEAFPHEKAPEASDVRQHLTELLDAYREQPDTILRDLNGWFAGVLIDRRQRRVFLFNDRYALGRVYVCEVPGALLFASEAKAILSVEPSTRSLAAEGVGQYLAFGTQFGNSTLFRGIRLLPAASCWDVSRPGAVVHRQYFSPSEWSNQPPLDSTTFTRSLQDTLRRILPSYFSASAPAGLSLTGGLDTRMVMAGMPPDNAPRPCYTYGGVYRECFDVKVARQVAACSGLQHVVLPLAEDFFSRFLDHAERTIWLTDGCLDLTGAHELSFSEAARHYSPVRVTGNYGSEILRSVCTFKHGPITASLVHPDMAPMLEDAKRQFDQFRGLHPVTFAAFCQVPWQLAGRRLAAETVLVLRSPYMDNELVSLTYRAPAGARGNPRASLEAIAALSPALASIPTDMGRRAARPTPAALATLVYRYILFKAEWYYNLGMPDAVVRLENVVPLRLLEPLFLGTHKIEHFRLWFKNQLRGVLLEVLTDPRTRQRPYLDPRGAVELAEDLARNRRNRAEDVNRIVALELAQRGLVERTYE